MKKVAALLLFLLGIAHSVNADDSITLMVCEDCGFEEPIIVDSDKPSYKEPPKEVQFFSYKRINHFREILAQFQAKETTQIPSEVLENVKLQIKKERVEVEQLTNNMAKDMLKKLGYNKLGYKK